MRLGRCPSAELELQLPILRAGNTELASARSMIWQGPREVLCALLGEAPIVPFVPRPRHLTTLEECAAKASSRRTRRDENRWKYCHVSRARGCRSGSGAGCIGFAAEGAGSSHQCGGQGRRGGSCDARQQRSSGGGGGEGIEIAGDGTFARPDDAATCTTCTGSVGGQKGAAASTTSSSPSDFRGAR